MEQKRHLTLGCQILGFNFVNYTRDPEMDRREDEPVGEEAGKTRWSSGKNVQSEAGLTPHNSMGREKFQTHCM